MGETPDEQLARANAEFLNAQNRNLGCLSWVYGIEFGVYVVFVGIPVLLLVACCCFGGWDVFVDR